MKIIKSFSPNYDKKKRPANSIKIIVIHYTGMQSERESIKKLTNSRSKVSSHYLINRKGKVFNLVQDKHVAWHAGRSCWGKYKNLNKNSIGIELVNKGHKFGYTNFKKKQISNLIKLCRRLIKKYKIKKKNVVGHSDIAPLRKIDPGEKFPWKYLAKNKVGIWHDNKPNFLRKYRGTKILMKKDKKKIIKNLDKIGYCFPVKNKSFLVKAIKAFQRHFRKELINGIFDQECIVIAQNLAKKL
jgi:N-acetylmuramoyl-L-alanine amidase